MDETTSGLGDLPVTSQDAQMGTADELEAFLFTEQDNGVGDAESRARELDAFLFPNDPLPQAEAEAPGFWSGVGDVVDDSVSSLAAGAASLGEGVLGLNSSLRDFSGPVAATRGAQALAETVGADSVAESIQGFRNTVEGYLGTDGSVINTLQDRREELTEGQSEALRTARQERQERVDNAGNLGSKIGVALWETVKSPRLALDAGLQSAPISLVGAGAGGLALRAGMSARGASGVAVATGSGIEGGLTSTQVYDAVMDIDPEVAMQNPDIAMMVEDGVPLDRALATVAGELSESTFFMQAAGSALASYIVPGARTVDNLLIQDLVKESLAGAGKNVVFRAVRGAGGEGGEEFLQSGLGKALENYAVGTIDESRKLSEGVGTTAAIGLADGAPMGGAAGIAQGFIGGREQESTTDTDVPPPADPTDPAPVDEAPARDPDFRFTRQGSGVMEQQTMDFGDGLVNTPEGQRQLDGVMEQQSLIDGVPELTQPPSRRNTGVMEQEDLLAEVEQMLPPATGPQSQLDLESAGFMERVEQAAKIDFDALFESNQRNEQAEALEQQIPQADNLEVKRYLERERDRAVANAPEDPNRFDYSYEREDLDIEFAPDPAEFKVPEQQGVKFAEPPAAEVQAARDEQRDMEIAFDTMGEIDLQFPKTSAALLERDRIIARNDRVQTQGELDVTNKPVQTDMGDLEQPPALGLESAPVDNNGTPDIVERVEPPLETQERLFDDVDQSTTPPSTQVNTNEEPRNAREVPSGNNPQQGQLKVDAPTSGRDQSQPTQRNDQRSVAEAGRSGQSVGQVSDDRPAFGRESPNAPLDPATQERLESVRAARKEIADAEKDYADAYGDPAPVAGVPPTQRAAIDKAVATAVAESNDRVRSVATFTDLPTQVQDTIREKLIRTRQPGAANGTVYQGRVYLINDQITNVKDVEPLVAHEIAHAAGRGKFGPRFPDILNELYEAIGGDRGAERLAQRYGMPLHRYNLMYRGDSEGVRTARVMDELLAHMAESNSKDQRSMARRALRQLKKIFRQYGTPSMRKRLRDDTRADREMGKILKEAHDWYFDQQFPFGDPVQRLEFNQNVARVFYDNDMPLSMGNRQARPSVAAWVGRVSDGPAGRAGKRYWNKKFGRTRTLGRATMDSVDRARGWRAMVSDAAMYNAKGMHKVVSSARLSGAQLTSLQRKLGHEPSKAEKRDYLYEQINRYIRGQTKVDLPADVKAFADRAREHLDGMSTLVADMMVRRMDSMAQNLSDEQYLLYEEAIMDPVKRKQMVRDIGQDDFENNGEMPAQLLKTFHLYSKILKNRGKYLHRSYQAHGDAKWKDRVMSDEDGILSEGVKAIKQIEKQDYINKIGRGKDKAAAKKRIKQFNEHANGRTTGEKPPGYDEFVVNQKDAVIKAKISAMLEKARKAGNPVNFISTGSKFGSRDLSSLMTRDEIPVAIRRLLGEYRDPRVNYVTTAESLGALIANDTFLNELKYSQTGLALFHRPVEIDGVMFDSQVAADTSESYSPLNGLYGTREYVEQLEMLVAPEPRAGYLDMYMKLNGMVKWGKTVGNESTHAANIASSGFLSFAKGYLTDPGAVKEAVAMLRSDMGLNPYKLTGKQKHYRAKRAKLINLGVLLDGGRSGEARALREDVEGGGISAKLSSFEITSNIPLSPRKIIDWVQSAYGWEDDFFKIIGFEHEHKYYKSKGYSDEEADQLAAEVVRNRLPTYSKVPQGVQDLRQFPLMGNFVSFSSEIIRNSGNDAIHMNTMWKNDKKRFARDAAHMAIAAAVPIALTMLSRSEEGVDEEMDGAARAFMPEWSEYGAIYYLSPDKNGNARYIDLSRYNPYSHYYKMGRTLTVDNGNSWDQRLRAFSSELIAPFTGFEITSGSLLDLFYNSRDRQGGVQVYNPQRDFWGKLKQTMKHLFTDLAPGTFNAQYRVAQSLGDDTNVNRYGKKLTFEDEMWAKVGARRSTVNIPYALDFRAGEFRREKADAQSILSDEVADQRGRTEQDLEDAWNEMMKSRNRVYRRGITFAKAATTFGMTPDDVERHLIKSSGLTKDDARALVEGYIPRYDMSRQFGERALQRALNQYGLPTPANKEDREAVRQKFEVRKEQIRRLQELQPD